MNSETVTRDISDSHVWARQGLPTSEPSAQSPSGRLGPGILIFSRRQQVLHMNRRALELTGHLNQTERGAGTDQRLAPLHDLSACIKEALDLRQDANIWELVELKRVIVNAGRIILVRGFGLEGRNTHDDSRIVIVLDEVASTGHLNETPVQDKPYTGNRRKEWLRRV